MFRFLVKSLPYKTDDNSKMICRVNIKFEMDNVKLVIEIVY